jgi:hypothetical protein
VGAAGGTYRCLAGWLGQVLELRCPPGPPRRSGGQVSYSLSFTNTSATPVDGLMVQFNNNVFGLVPSNQVVPVPQLAPGATAAASVPVAFNAAKQAPAPANPKLQVRRAAAEGRPVGPGWLAGLRAKRSCTSARPVQGSAAQRSIGRHARPKSPRRTGRLA